MPFARSLARLLFAQPSDVAKIDVHFIDLNEPGRSSCMSTDECGAYLAHMVSSPRGGLAAWMWALRRVPGKRHAPHPAPSHARSCTLTAPPTIARAASQINRTQQPSTFLRLIILLVCFFVLHCL